MEFRKLLPWLAVLSQGREFTARDVSKRMPMLSTKTASNELARLYRMGFLRRRKVKRVCTTRSGARCYRGYEYRYAISIQGLRYLHWMGTRKDDSTAKSERIANEIVDALRKHSSPARQLAASQILDEVFSSSNKRFPMLKRLTEIRLTQMLDGLDEDERRDKRIQRLEKEVEDLQKKMTLMRERHAREIQEKEKMIQRRDKMIQVQEETIQVQKRTISELQTKLPQMEVELLKLRISNMGRSEKARR